jgi:ComF family protein
MELMGKGMALWQWSMGALYQPPRIMPAFELVTPSERGGNSSALCDNRHSMFSTRRDLAGRLAFLLGAGCVLCKRQGPESCAACNAAVSARERGILRCSMCADRRTDRCADRSMSATCERCLAAPHAFSRTVCGGEYAPPLDVVERALKFQGRTHAARALASWLNGAMQEAGLDPALDCLIPVPLSRQRLASRGYNQASLIARHLARHSGLRVKHGALHRVRDTPALSLLHTAERAQAIRGAFACIEPLHGRVVALVDDVMTTGATLNAAAQALRDAGAREVIALVALRTPAS